MIPTIELFVKSSNYDREDFGACPISQTWFMAFYVLMEKTLLNLKVTPVSMEMQPENYLRLNVSRRLPVARIESGTSPQGKDLSNHVYGTTDDLEQLITIFQWTQLSLPSMNADAVQAQSISADILKSFNILLKTKNNKPLISTLTRLDGFLSSKSTKYSISEEITYTDCVLMPRLQHVRVAGMELERFDIPENLKHLRTYIKNMYDEKVFEVTCPKNKDIIAQHVDKVYADKPRRKLSINEDSKLLTI